MGGNRDTEIVLGIPVHTLFNYTILEKINNIGSHKRPDLRTDNRSGVGGGKVRGWVQFYTCLDYG